MDVNRTERNNNTENNTPAVTKTAKSNDAQNFSKELKGSSDNLDSATNLAVADMSGKVSSSDLQGGKQAMDGMMNIIREAATATGSADDGNFSQSEVLGMNEWIRGNRLGEWTALHGDDEGKTETGFHKWQGDGGKFKYNGEDFVNTVLDGINHLGFEFDGKNFLNEDGDANANLKDMTDWLNTAYFSDFAEGITVAEGKGGEGAAGAEKAGAEEPAGAEEKAGAEEPAGVEEPAGTEEAAEVKEPTAAETASGTSIADIDDFPEWLQLLAAMLGISPEELQGLLKGVLNEDGTINKDKLAEKLVEKGMDPEKAQVYAAKMADSFDKLTSEGGPLDGLSKDEIIAKAGEAVLENIPEADKEGISSLVSEMVSESKNAGGSYSPQVDSLEIGDTMADNFTGIMKEKGYQEETGNPGYYQSGMFA